jgi:hypothetical protein
MATRYALLVANLSLGTRAALIQPAMQALAWKLNRSDFWAPIHLGSSVYHVQSPSGQLSASLNRRDFQPGGHLPCTVVTLNSSSSTLSATFIKDIIASYLIDDIWSAEQFLDCVYVQYNGTASKVPIDPSYLEFAQAYGVSTTFLSSVFDITGLYSTVVASLYPVKSPCELKNGPYVITLPNCEGSGLTLTPVYALHPDTYEGM